jgi:hypothetical protein
VTRPRGSRPASTPAPSSCRCTTTTPARPCRPPGIPGTGSSWRWPPSAGRPEAIRDLQLDDLNPGNRRLTIAGRTRPLDDLTRQMIPGWLGRRRSRWPDTANPHLIINQQTAMETGPVSKAWLTGSFRGQAATLERLRVHRQPGEALTQGPDPLHPASVSGLDPKTAIRHAENARALLVTTAEEQDPAGPREPKGQNRP